MPIGVRSDIEGPIALFVAWTLHDVEEALTFPAMFTALADETGVDALRLDRRQSWAAVGLMGAFIVAACVAGARTGGRSRSVLEQLGGDQPRWAVSLKKSFGCPVAAGALWVAHRGGIVSRASDAGSRPMDHQRSSDPSSAHRRGRAARAARPGVMRTPGSPDRSAMHLAKKLATSKLAKWSRNRSSSAVLTGTASRMRRYSMHSDFPSDILCKTTR